MKKKLDKRTKEYKEWKKQQKAEGLGDIVEKITEATGIKSAVKWLAGDDCGCEERKEFLNNNWLAEFLAEHWDNDTERWSKGINNHSKVKLIKMYNRVFKVKQDTGTTCGSCIRDIADRMKRVYEAY
mgnify:CR=1 FL=1